MREVYKSKSRNICRFLGFFPINRLNNLSFQANFVYINMNISSSYRLDFLPTFNTIYGVFYETKYFNTS